MFHSPPFPVAAYDFVHHAAPSLRFLGRVTEVTSDLDDVMGSAGDPYRSRGVDSAACDVTRTLRDVYKSRDVLSVTSPSVRDVITGLRRRRCLGNRCSCCEACRSWISGSRWPTWHPAGGLRSLVDRCRSVLVFDPASLRNSLYRRVTSPPILVTSPGRRLTSLVQESCCGER